MLKFFTASILILSTWLIGSNAMATSYYTYINGGNNGLWATAGTWTTDPSGLSLTGSAVPANGDVVYILNGFTVSLDANVTTTGLSIIISNGGTLDLATFTMATINNLSGAGTLKIKSGYFPTITTNNFLSSYGSGATVEFYDFSGTLPVSINYPNLIFSNSTSTNTTITISNSAAYSLGVLGNLETLTTGTGTLSVVLGSVADNVITMTVNGDVLVGTATTIRTGAFDAIHSIRLYGNMTNNGTIDFSNAAQFNASGNGAAHLSFLGATDRTFACNGRTDLYTLTVNKGLSNTNTLYVTSTNSANLNFYSNSQLIMISNGTLKLGANINITRLYGSGSANYDVGSSTASPMLWIDGATVNANGSALVVYGKFRISSGSFTTLGGQGSVIREEGQYIIEGGTFTTEKFRPSTTASTHRGSFTMTGGTFNASGTSGSDNRYARFSLPFPEQVFIMSGGTINVNNPQSGATAANGGIHIGCNTSNYSVTGGTFNAILSGTAAFFDIASTVPFWNLSISRTGGTPTTVRLEGIGTVGGTILTAQPLTVLNDFIIDGPNSPVFNATGLNVSVGRNFTIQSGATYTPSANTTFFTGSADQTFSNNGTITSGLYNLTMNKPSGALILGGTASSYTVTNVLTLTKGILNDGGKTILVSGDIHNEASHAGTGNITLNGVNTQTISGNGNGIFGNLVLNNNSNPGVTVTSDLAVSGILTLAGTGNSIFNIDHYQLSLTSTSSASLTTSGNPFGSTKMVRTSGFQSDRGIRKSYGDLTPFTYHFGVGNSYTPATIQLTAAPTSYGAITARPVNSRHPLTVAGNTNNLTWYWKVVSSGFTGLGPTAISHTYSFLDAHVLPAGNDVNYIPARYSPTAWTIISNLAQVNEATNVISFTGVGYIDGEFTAGVPAAFGTVKIFYSKRNGNWTNTAPGTTPWSNVSHSGPDATTSPVVGDHVYIGDGTTFNHTITITTNGQASGGLEISAGSILDVGTSTGHNFGTFENTPITGSGLLRISSVTAFAEFPAGDFGNFIRASGGTVEYYTTGSQDFTIPLSSSAPSHLPLISYRHLNLTPGNGRYIAMPDQDERIFGNLTIQGTSGSGIVRLNAAAPTTLILNGNLNVNSGNLQFRNGSAQNIAIDGNLNVASGATFDIAGTGAATLHSITLAGNLINNGAFDLANSAAYRCNITFTGTANTSITGTGSTTDFNTITVSKGSSQVPVLNVNAAAFTLSGTTLPLILNSGTFRLTSAQTVTVANGASFSIPATARLSANGGTLQITGNDNIDLLLAGTLEILNGTVNVGTTARDNSIEYAATGQPTIIVSGGTLNVQAQVRRSFASSQGALIYNQSGSSIVTVGISDAATTSRGVFESLNPGSSFTMSGGTLRLSTPTGSSSIADLYLQSASHSVTGGTIEIGTGATAKTFDVNTIIPLHSLTVTGSTNIARLEYNGVTLRGSLEIQSDNIFRASGYNVSIAGNFVNANPLSTTGVSAGGYQPGNINQTTTLNSSVNNQTINGVSANLTNFGNLVINNTFSSGTVGLLANTNLRVNGNLILSNGTLDGYNNTITAMGGVSNSATHTSITTGSITLAGGSNQTISGNGTGKFGNVILNNSYGASFAANQEITGTLTLADGSLNISSYALNLSNTSLTAIVGAGPSRYITTSGNLSDAGITKAFAAALTNGNFIYPIGVSGKYTPANYTLTTGGSGGTITIRPVNSKHPSATGSGTAFINYYWGVTHSGININSLTHTYTYAAIDQQGNIADYRDARFKGGAWTIGITAGNPNTTTRVITFTNTDLQGDYTTGEPTAFVNPTTYTSIASGNWESDLAVWDIDPPGTGIGPPAGSFVIISDGHTVTVTANAKRMATLEVRGRLHLGTTSGHDFGTVSPNGIGDKTIQIQSSVFPSGNFTNFTAANGGTVEYNGVVTLPTQNTYNNISFTGAGLKTLPNADLTINGNFTIVAGNVTNAVSHRNITLTSTAGNFTNQGIFFMGNGGVRVGGNLVNTGAGTTFSIGNGTQGLRITGNLFNNSNATFICNTDSIGVRGTFSNNATFIGSTGIIRVSGNFINTNSYTGGAGELSIQGSFTNNNSFSAGTGTATVMGSFINSGAQAVYHANTNVLNIGGSFTLASASSFIAGNGVLFVGGNWNNTASFTAGTGSAYFNGIATQSITGETTFNNLSVNNATAVTLNNNIHITDLLTLAVGNIVTGSHTVNLLNSTVQPVTSYSTSSFIDGKLSIQYPDASGSSRVFPVGKGTLYRPVTIQQGDVSTSPVVRVEMINARPTGDFPEIIGILSEARYYAIDLLSGVINMPLIELSFNTNGVPDELIAIAGNVRIMRSTDPAGPWTDEGGSGVFSPAEPVGYAVSGVTTINNPTYFALGYRNTPLPLTLKSFDAILKNGVVELNWATYSELNNNYFTIERSGSGLSFDSIGYVDAAGTSNKTLQYQALDSEPLSGISYYRLKQTDYDGKFTYTHVVRVVNQNIDQPSFIVYPNPAESTNAVYVKFTSENFKNVYAVITNVSGIVFFAGEINSSNTFDINALNLIHKLDRGLYIIQITADDFKVARKFVIH